MGYLSGVSAARGLSAASIATAMGLHSHNHLNAIRKGATPLRHYADRWAEVVGVDLDEPVLLDLLLLQFLTKIYGSLESANVPVRDKVLFMDEILRSFELGVNARIEPLSAS